MVWCGEAETFASFFLATGAVVTDALEKKAGDRWRRMAEPKISRRLTCTCASTSIKSHTHECITSARRSYEFDNNKNQKSSGFTRPSTVVLQVLLVVLVRTRAKQFFTDEIIKEKKKKTVARSGSS